MFFSIFLRLPFFMRNFPSDLDTSAVKIKKNEINFKVCWKSLLKNCNGASKKRICDSPWGFWNCQSRTKFSWNHRTIGRKIKMCKFVRRQTGHMQSFESDEQKIQNRSWCSSFRVRLFRIYFWVGYVISDRSILISCSFFVTWRLNTCFCFLSLPSKLSECRQVLSDSFLSLVRTSDRSDVIVLQNGQKHRKS